MTTDTGSYGGFELGGLSLALPMAALREVVPCDRLQPMPTLCPAVVGGIDLRGTTVPVLDLRCLLGRGTPALASPVVIVMVEQGRLLGLLASAITGVFTAPESGLRPIHVADPVAAVLAASLHRPDTNGLVHLLAPQALAALPTVPMVQDPEPGRQQGAESGDDAAMAVAGLPMMLARSARLCVAIDAMAVHATLLAPQIQDSPLAGGVCLGVMDHAGVRVPMVDLLSLCGLGPRDPQQSMQAFLLRTPVGLVGFCVDQVLEIVRADLAGVVPLPALALPGAHLFNGVVPLSALVAASQDALAGLDAQFLVLDARTLGADATLTGLVRACQPQGSAASGWSAVASDAPHQRSMITFDFSGETAVPLGQVSEIMPFDPASATFGSDGAVLGLVVNRGRSIPVVHLGRLAGLPDEPLGPSASVLVVQSDTDWLGFAVPGLRTIEQADWEPALPEHTLRGQPAVSRLLQGRRLAKVGQGRSERLLRVLDLQGVAHAMREQFTGAAAGGGGGHQADLPREHPPHRPANPPPC